MAKNMIDDQTRIWNLNNLKSEEYFAEMILKNNN